MMSKFVTYFRILAAFSALASSIVTQGTAEQNFTHSRSSLFVVRQLTEQHTQWKNPNPISMPLLNHAWKHNGVAAGVRGGNPPVPQLTTLAEPSLQGLTKQLPQQLLQQNNDDIANMIASSVLRLAINVGTELSENTYFSKSEVFSPLSIMSALALLLAGAKGRSYQQLKPIFGYDLNTALSNDPNYASMLHREFGLLLQDIEQDNIGSMHQRKNPKWRYTPERANIRSQAPNLQPIVHVIKVANGLFSQTGYSLNPNYKDVVKAIYNSELEQLDFQNNAEGARQHINSWVDRNTFGKIKNVINNAIPPSTNMMIASVLYFKGFWENTFFEAATIPDNFYPEGEGRPAIKVPMMATGGVFPYYEAREYDCRIIGLPYRGNLSTMYIIQPNLSSRAKLKDFQSKITPEAIEDMISKMAYRSAVMAFPKMHFVRNLNLKEILQRFGVLDIFSSTASDLSLIGASKLNSSPSSITKLMQSSRAPSRPLHGQPMHNYAQRPELMDRFNEAPLFFSTRFGDIANPIKSTNNLTETAVTSNNETLDEKAATVTDEDLTTTTPIPMSLNETSETPRRKRQTTNGLRSLSLLEEERLADAPNKSDLYVDDILHKVDFEVNEQGTEAAAATLTYLKRSGTDVIFRCDTPFMLLLRHDPSKLILFYSIVNEPEI